MHTRKAGYAAQSARAKLSFIAGSCTSAVPNGWGENSSSAGPGWAAVPCVLCRAVTPPPSIERMSALEAKIGTDRSIAAVSSPPPTAWHTDQSAMHRALSQCTAQGGKLRSDGTLGPYLVAGRPLSSQGRRGAFARRAASTLQRQSAAAPVLATAQPQQQPAAQEQQHPEPAAEEQQPAAAAAAAAAPVEAEEQQKAALQDRERSQAGEAGNRGQREQQQAAAQRQDARREQPIAQLPIDDITGWTWQVGELQPALLSSCSTQRRAASSSHPQPSRGLMAVART